MPRRRGSPSGLAISSPPGAGSPSPRPVLVTVGSLLVVATLYVALAVLLGAQLPSRAAVAGVHVGGMTQAAAAERIEGKLHARLERPVTIDLASTLVTVRPRELGLAVDLRSTLGQATGFSLDPRRVWWRLTGGGDLPLRVDLDSAAAAQTLQKDIATVDRPVVEPAVTFRQGTVQVVRPREGLRVDLAATLERVRSQWPGSSPVVAVVEHTQPAVASPEVDRAVAQVARPAIATPLVAVLGRTPTTLSPADFAPALRMVVQGDTLALRVDATDLAGVLRAHVDGLETEPVDATLRLSQGRPQIVKAVPGRRLNQRDTGAAALVALTTPGAATPARTLTADPTADPTTSTDGRTDNAGTRTVGIVTREVAAAVTTAQAQAWGVDQQVGQAEVPDVVAGLPGSDSARATVRFGAAAVDGQVIPAGGTLALSRLIGDPTGRLGDAAEAESSGIVWRPGGGLSQLASALYAAGWRAGLGLGPRRAHSVYLPDYPLGLDAVYSWPDADVTVRNRGPAPVLVGATVSGGRLRVVLWGRADIAVTADVGPRRGGRAAVVRQESGPDCTQQPLAAPGFDVVVSREVIRGRTRSPRESSEVHYDPLQPVNCVVSGEPPRGDPSGQGPA
ncbi:MAG: VanW family protein [Micrococcales bacterium]|nr:VanW family protein [Micrococcales bacterium]